jgi:hypothetical protein
MNHSNIKEKLLSTSRCLRDGINKWIRNRIYINEGSEVISKCSL